VKQGTEITWKRHLIDNSWSQPHSLALADPGRGRRAELIAGKRFMAQQRRRSREMEPLGVYWYKLTRGPEVTWTKHVLSYNEGIGSGLNLVATDLDGDGDVDIVVTASGRPGVV